VKKNKLNYRNFTKSYSKSQDNRLVTETCSLRDRDSHNGSRDEFRDRDRLETPSLVFTSSNATNSYILQYQGQGPILKVCGVHNQTDSDVTFS